VTKKKRWPCKIDAGVVKWCWALDEVLQMPGGRGTRAQGVEVQSMLNMDTLKFSRNLIVIKSGKCGKKGLVMNLCPFCGGELVAGINNVLVAQRIEQGSSKPEVAGSIPAERAKSAPLCGVSHNNGERDPAEMPDSGGADAQAFSQADGGAK
jgi:hypothetical protein